MLPLFTNYKVTLVEKINHEQEEVSHLYHTSFLEYNLYSFIL